MQIPALLLAFALFLSGCASPLAIRLDEHGTPFVHNTSGRELHDVSLRVAGANVDGHTAFEEIEIPTWIADDWRSAPGMNLDRLAVLEVRGESREIKNLRVRWQAPWTRIYVTTFGF